MTHAEIVLRPDLHLDAAPVGPLHERWPDRAAPGRDAVRVYLADVRWSVSLVSAPTGLRWSLALAGVGAVAAGAAPAA